MCAVQRCLLNQMPPALKDVSLMTKPHLEMATSSGLLLSAPSSAEMNADGWELLEITVDSGDCGTVLPTGMLSSINVVSTEASRNLETYEVANGCTTVNKGEKRCVMMTPGSQIPKGITFQVTDVHKPLMSVGAMCDAGYECLLSKRGGFIRDEETGEMIPLQRKGNLYVLRAWVRTAEGTPFGGPR